MKKLTKDEIMTRLEKPNGSAELATDNRVDKTALLKDTSELFIEKGLGSALLVRLAKSRAFVIKMSENAELVDAIRRAVCDEASPKLRRNGARLLGSLSRSKEDAELIAQRLDEEETRFVRPSLLLALGAIGGETAQKALSVYTPALPADESEKKHYDEEVEALKQARAACMEHEKHEFIALDREYELELSAPDRLTMQLAGELTDIGVDSYDIRRDSLKVKTSDYRALFEARCFSEALFVVGTLEKLTAEDAASAFMKFVPEFMAHTHGGKAPYCYRIELRGDKVVESSVFKKQLRDLIDEKGELINAPSDYEIELHIETGAGGARLYLKLYTVKDERFSYRKESIPASMNPATAAAVLRFAQEHLSVNARVIDPCCGSGTLLIERGIMSPCESLTGVDIAHKAIDAARLNADAAVIRCGIKQAKFICNDILRFETKRPYDELICNLPFGNRVGDHSSCEKLYTALLDKLPRMLKKGGVALLYTMEFTLLKKLVRERSFLELVAQGRTEAGGLTPMIFILRVK